MSRATTVFLLDDHELVRDGLRQLIDSTDDLCVVGEAGTCAEAGEMIRSLCPDVALLDVRLPDGSGLDLLRDLHAELPEVGFVMLTSYADGDAHARSIEAGAVGFAVKQVRGLQLVEQIRRAADGQPARAGTRGHVPSPLGADREPDPRLGSLTRRQREILDLVAIGRTNRSIAAELGLSEKTVKNSVSAILLKLGVSRRVEAAVFATESALAATKNA